MVSSRRDQKPCNDDQSKEYMYKVMGEKEIKTKQKTQLESRIFTSNDEI